MNICLFTSEEIEKTLDWNDERAIHLNKILHKKTGDTFCAGIINGQAGIATITNTIPITNPKTNKTELSYKFTFEAKSDGKKLFPLKMIIGFPRPIQLKRLLRDIAALGVCQVHLTGTELSEKSYMQSNLVEQGTAYQMLLDGTIQAASTHVPELFIHSSLKECLAALDYSDFEKNEKTKKFALDNIQANQSLQECVNCAKEKTYFVAAIGSERGWTNNERNLLLQNNFTLCSMGNRVMRTETAATASASIILSNLGFLN